MLAWVVTFRSTLRRTHKSRSPRALFAKGLPRALCAIGDSGPAGKVAIRLFRASPFASSISSCPPILPTIFLSPLECAVADKHRVLPVFSRNRQASSPLEATLMRTPVSVDSKWFTVRLTPLESALTKNTRGTPNFPTCKRSNFANLSSNPYLVTSLPPTSLLPQSCQSHCSRTPLVPQ